MTAIMQMTSLRRIAMIGNSMPRRCGIATFTTHLHEAIVKSAPTLCASIVALNDHDKSYQYPSEVEFKINDSRPKDYIDAAAFLNAGKFDAVSLQHEFGIFGGEAGVYIMELLSRLTMPVITTFHTVLSAPSPAQYDIVQRIAEVSGGLVVMTQMACEILSSVYQIDIRKISVIPHGIPDLPIAEEKTAKRKLHFDGRSVILTFGLLSPGKGIEVMIDAMPEILRRCPDAVYVVLGATHPNLVREEGEAYREGLLARTRVLGIENHVVFRDQFVDEKTLLDFIAMCDVYVTPYLNAAQMTSGTLAYSFGLGRAVVSTPYCHARELLADDRGVLVPFGDAGAIGLAIADLLTNPNRRHALGRKAYQYSRSMVWARAARHYITLFEGLVNAQRQIARVRLAALPPFVANIRLPQANTQYFLSLCDATGLLQHAVHSVPDRDHGYCVDDNARALILACALPASGNASLPVQSMSHFTAFIQHAWNAGSGRFRNFMSFDRRWLEEVGSEDSHGRTLWALGVCAQGGDTASRREWAAALFAQALPVVIDFIHPRSWAFTLLGLHEYCQAKPKDLGAVSCRQILADRLLSLFKNCQTANWAWFESALTYDNARLSQALIQFGTATGSKPHLDAGLRSLTWLIQQQTAPLGYFRPIGTSGYGKGTRTLRIFDQQPVEATATIAACYAAYQADGEFAWPLAANTAFAWFHGANDLGVVVVDAIDGSCRDGLHPDRANENRGAESVLSSLMAITDMQRIAQVTVQPVRYQLA